jgi:hypothetical protein
MDRRLLLVCAWCGPLFALLFAIGFAVLAGFLPPPSPNDSAAKIVSMYRDHRDAIRFGTVFMMLGTPFIAPWGAVIAAQTRRTERGFPVLACIQLVCVGVVVLTIAVFVLIWAVASFRAGAVSADTTQTLNDIAFFLLLFDYSPFCLWCLTIAVAILRDRSDVPVFPRWAGYVNLWVVAMSLPGGLIVFFKTGPLAYDGLIAFYFPVVIFFVWLVTMTVVTIAAIKAQDEPAIN